MKSFNEFDTKFRQLERWCGNDPSRIEWLVKNSPEVRRLIGSLYFWEREFESKLTKHRFQQVPSWFLERYKSYKERFGPQVQEVYGRLWLSAFTVDGLDGIPADEILYPDGRPPPKNDDQDENTSWSMPGERAQDIDFVISWAWQKYYDLKYEVPYAEELGAGLDAWEWFTETVGIDLAGIDERWKKLPRTLIPSHMERTASANGYDGLVDLLDDATKAYVFGLPAAAIAMCRAVCERVLKEYYFCDDQKEESFGKLEFLAEKKYRNVKELKLKKYIKFANGVLHNHRGEDLAESELETARQFLKTTKALIENVSSLPAE